MNPTPEPADASTRVLPTETEPALDATRIVGAAALDEVLTVHTSMTDAAPAAEPSKGQVGVLAIGTRLAEFEITELIGQGGFGIVYAAWDHALERVVAIKEYMPSSLASRLESGSVAALSLRHQETFDLGMRSFINEARLLAQFDHPSLLKVYRFWQDNGTAYMVMPLYRGQTLKQALAERQGQVPQTWLLDIMNGVTQALAVMHDAQCYHRDIAPDNILLLEGSGLPVVLDFGAARRVITDKTQAITVILKPGYAPIEQYAEVPDMTQGAWTDVYALCAVMHVAVTGHSPPPSVARLLSDSYQPLAGQEQLRARYATSLLEAVDAGLAVRPQDRIASMAALRTALGLGAGGASVAAGGSAAITAAGPRPTSLPAAEPPPGSPHALRLPRSVWWSAGGAALLLGLLGWWQIRAPAERVPSLAKESAVVPSPASGGAPATSAIDSNQAAAQVAAPVLTPPVTPSQSLQRLVDGASADFDVKTAVTRPSVRVGQDRLEFQVQSARDGYVYVFLLSSGGDLFLLFPNALDKRNRIVAGAAPLTLPRPSWPMEAGGPPGTNQFVAMVSTRERDFRSAGLQNEGVFGQFPLTILQALEASQPTGSAPLAGQALCEGAVPCDDSYGASAFKIVEK